MTLEGQLEGLLGQAVRADPSRRHTIEPDLGRRIVDALQRAAQPLVAEAKPFALVVQPAIRVAIRKLVKTVLPDTPVMSFFEVPEDKAVEVVAVIGAPEALAGMNALPNFKASFADRTPATLGDAPLTYGRDAHAPRATWRRWRASICRWSAASPGTSMAACRPRSRSRI